MSIYTSCDDMLFLSLIKITSSSDIIDQKEYEIIIYGYL